MGDVYAFRSRQPVHSHLAIRRRERKTQRFKSPGSAQRFLSVHAASRTCSTSNAISSPATRSALLEAKRFRIRRSDRGLNKSRALRLSFGRSQVLVIIPDFDIAGFSIKKILTESGIVGKPSGLRGLPSGRCRGRTCDPSRGKTLLHCVPLNALRWRRDKCPLSRSVPQFGAWSQKQGPLHFTAHTTRRPRARA